VHNITVECQWQPLYKDVLANILDFYINHEGRFHSENFLHQCVLSPIRCRRLLNRSSSVARFLWAKIVQNRLNKHERAHANHKIHKQKGRLLPTGGRPSQFYDNPEQWGGSPCLIPIPKEDIARLVAQYVPHDLFVFCDPQIHDVATDALSNLGNPQLRPENGWDIFAHMIPLVEACLDAILHEGATMRACPESAD
jgi:hypothetical protein